MAKRKLPKGIREKNGAYEARAMVNGIKINMSSANLDNLIEDFERAKEQARRRVHYMKSEMSLNEWFDEWFDEVKAHKVKETSIRPMKNNFKKMGNLISCLFFIVLYPPMLNYAFCAF